MCACEKKLQSKLDQCCVVRVFNSELKRKSYDRHKYISVRIVSTAFEFQFPGAFRSFNTEKKNRIERSSKFFFIVNSKERYDI